MRIIDARGHRCPVPSLRLRRALEQARVGEVISLTADDPMARIDVPHLVRALGQALVDTREEDGVLTFVVRKIR